MRQFLCVLALAIVCGCSDKPVTSDPVSDYRAELQTLLSSGLESGEIAGYIEPTKAVIAKMKAAKSPVAGQLETQVAALEAEQNPENRKQMISEILRIASQ